MDVMDVDRNKGFTFPDWLGSQTAPAATTTASPTARDEPLPTDGPPIAPMSPQDVATMRAWPTERKARWGTLVELGESEGLPSKVAKAYAFLAVSNEIMADGPAIIPPPEADFIGWRPERVEPAPRVKAVRGTKTRRYLTVDLGI